MIVFLIVLNTVFLTLESVDNSDEFKFLLHQVNLVFVVIFTIEMVLKLIGLGLTFYFSNMWNRLDAFIVIFSLISLDERFIQHFNFNVTAFRIIRITRLLKLVKTSKRLR